MNANDHLQLAQQLLNSIQYDLGRASEDQRLRLEMLEIEYKERIDYWKGQISETVN